MDSQGQLPGEGRGATEPEGLPELARARMCLLPLPPQPEMVRGYLCLMPVPPQPEMVKGYLCLIPLPPQPKMIRGALCLMPDSSPGPDALRPSWATTDEDYDELAVAGR